MTSLAIHMPTFVLRPFQDVIYYATFHTRQWMTPAGATNTSWTGSQYGLTDEDGYFVNKDGSISRVAHQSDRIRVKDFERWYSRHGALFDP